MKSLFYISKRAGHLEDATYVQRVVGRFGVEVRSFYNSFKMFYDSYPNKAIAAVIGLLAAAVGLSYSSILRFFDWIKGINGFVKELSDSIYLFDNSISKVVNLTNDKKMQGGIWNYRSILRKHFSEFAGIENLDCTTEQFQKSLQALIETALWIKEEWGSLELQALQEKNPNIRLLRNNVEKSLEKLINYLSKIEEFEPIIQKVTNISNSKKSRPTFFEPQKKSFYISKRAHFEDFPKEILNEIFIWASGIFCRYAAKDTSNATELRKLALSYATQELPEKEFLINLSNWKYSRFFPEDLTVKIEILPHAVELQNPDVLAFYDRQSFNIKIGYKILDKSLIKTIKQLKITIEHELLHFLQQAAHLYSNVDFGFPFGSVIPEGINDDTLLFEFYPHIIDVYNSLKTVFQEFDKRYWPIIFKVSMNVIDDSIFIEDKEGNRHQFNPIPYVVDLKNSNQKVWKAFIKKLYLYMQGVK